MHIMCVHEVKSCAHYVCSFKSMLVTGKCTRLCPVLVTGVFMTLCPALITGVFIRLCPVFISGVFLRLITVLITGVYTRLCPVPVTWPSREVTSALALWWPSCPQRTWSSCHIPLSSRKHWLAASKQVGTLTQ